MRGGPEMRRRWITAVVSGLLMLLVTVFGILTFLPVNGDKVFSNVVIGAVNSCEGDVRLQIDFAACEALIPGYPTREIWKELYDFKGGEEKPIPFFFFHIPCESMPDYFTNKKRRESDSDLRHITVIANDLYVDGRELSPAEGRKIARLCRTMAEVRR